MDTKEINSGTTEKPTRDDEQNGATNGLRLLARLLAQHHRRMLQGVMAEPYEESKPQL